ncbi:APG12-domain-containing protein [Dacryopinax primogenitus]|uniref:Ubiquitin-like protein ATG12 n=1 Tax=Dacryopinax primogenitus (strain DJM 731) TaxID=1858805 RepID=M5FQI1_DACPD|nr:APG12-domain-containing protein [Dacryopinax primogenitus]EJT97733.1 APG12-domain-containing protein [Dacryopinax primogenitus]
MALLPIDDSTPPVGPTPSIASSGTPGVAGALEAYRQKDMTKVRFKAIGNAPIMRQNYYRITASNRFQAVIQFLRKELGWKAADPLFTYINSAFSPTPDDTVANLYKCFATEGHLIVNYSSTAAWG